MTIRLSIPFGSQHVALAEPVRFSFETDNETIRGVQADIGYVHRGIEKACTEKFRFQQVVYAVGRVCGLCAVCHSTAYALAVEQLLDAAPSKRALYLRMLLLEMDRVHSHLFCLAHTAECAGFEALFMRIMAGRETVMMLQELLTGNRVQFDYVNIGGVNRDLDRDTSAAVRARLAGLTTLVEQLREVFGANWGLSLRFKGVGVLDRQQATLTNAVGPLARAAGLAFDVRQETGLLPYDEVGFELVTESGGDIHCRNLVRLRELAVSLTMIANILDNLPAGPIQTKVKGLPQGEAVARLEAPRGELFYYVRAVRSPYLDRLRIKAPTFSNLEAMLRVFTNEAYASAPAILASLDPCLSCTAR